MKTLRTIVVALLMSVAATAAFGSCVATGPISGSSSPGAGVKPALYINADTNGCSFQLQAISGSLFYNGASGGQAVVVEEGSNSTCTTGENLLWAGFLATTATVPLAHFEVYLGTSSLTVSNPQYVCVLWSGTLPAAASAAVNVSGQLF
jgi:hypothetical protein